MRLSLMLKNSRIRNFSTQSFDRRIPKLVAGMKNPQSLGYSVQNANTDVEIVFTRRPLRAISVTLLASFEAFRRETVGLQRKRAEQSLMWHF